MVRIIRFGSVLPCALKRARVMPGRVVSPECERDLKLICLVLSLEYYSMLVVGAFYVRELNENLTTKSTNCLFQHNPSLYLPWLFLYSIIIFVEFFIFMSNIFKEGLVIRKSAILMTTLIIFNWLSIFCAFLRIVEYK